MVTIQQFTLLKTIRSQWSMYLLHHFVHCYRVLRICLLFSWHYFQTLHENTWYAIFSFANLKTDFGFMNSSNLWHDSKHSSSSNKENSSLNNRGLRAPEKRLKSLNVLRECRTKSLPDIIPSAHFCIGGHNSFRVFCNVDIIPPALFYKVDKIPSVNFPTRTKPLPAEIPYISPSWSESYLNTWLLF